MAHSHRNIEILDDPRGESFFDLAYYCEDSSAQLHDTSSSEPQTLNEARPSSQDSRLELHQGQAMSSEAAAEFLNNETATTDISFEAVGGPAQPANDTRNEVLYNHEHPSGTDSPSAEIVNIDDRIEEIDLILERRKLQKRRQVILQKLPDKQQAETFERPEVQTIRMASDSGTQSFSQDVTHDEASKKSDSFPTGTVPFDNDLGDQYYGANFSTSDNDPLQMVPVGKYFHSGVAFTDPSNSGFAHLSNNAFEGSSHFETLEQIDHADTRPSYLSSLHPFDNLPAGPPNCGSNNFHGLQGSSLALDTDQTIMQPSSTSLQHGPSLHADPVQHAPNLSSSQHERTLHSSETSMIVRKRPTTPQPTHVQRLSAIQHQLAKKTGVPEISLGVLCFNTGTPPKRRRTDSQKQSKKDVENVGGSCFLCLVIKKKCSSQRPCDTCRDYWQKRVHNSTSFMWTCDVQSKLADLNVFSYLSEGISEAELSDTVISQFSTLGAFMQKFAYLFDLIDSLEPFRAKYFLRFFEEKKLHWYSYTHAIVKWKRVLVYVVPGLQDALAIIERLYRFLCSSILGVCDQLHRNTHKFWTVMVSVVAFEEIKHLTNMEISDPSAVDHVKLVLKSRLKVFCSRIFDGSKDDIFNETIINGLVMVVNREEELSLCLPQRYQCYRPLAADIQGGSSVSSLNLSACLLRRFDSSSDCYDNEQTDNCCCGWASDSTPLGFLSLFGHSARSFGRYIHSGPHKVIEMKGEIIFDTLHVMDTVFGGPWADHLSLDKTKLIFGVVLSTMLRKLFLSMDYYTDNFIKAELPVDFLASLATYCRPEFFALTLRSAVAAYSEFRDSRGRGELEAMNYQELVLEFCDWEWSREDFQHENFNRRVSGIMEKCIWMTVLKPPDTDMSSTEDDPSDELEEMPVDVDMASDGASTVWESSN